MRVPVTLVRHSPLGGTWITAQVPFKRTIWVRPGATLTRRLLAHELRHVIQAETRPWPLAYFWQWATTTRNYHTMPFEVEARAAEKDPEYLAWAEEILDGRADATIR